MELKDELIKKLEEDVENVLDVIEKNNRWNRR